MYCILSYANEKILIFKYTFNQHPVKLAQFTKSNDSINVAQSVCFTVCPLCYVEALPRTLHFLSCSCKELYFFLANDTKNLLVTF